MTTPITYKRIVKGMVGLEKSYHTIAVLADGGVEVTIYVKAPIKERVANYYESTHQEEIQQSIQLEMYKRSLPKLPKQVNQTAVPRKLPVARPSTSQFQRSDETAYCSECNKYSYKGYRLRSGEFICRDCKNLKSNPNPKPRLVFQNVEGGRRKH